MCCFTKIRTMIRPWSTAAILRRVRSGPTLIALVYQPFRISTFCINFTAMA
jgi:hypothetical protein